SLQRRGLGARDSHLAPCRRDAQLRDARERLIVIDDGAVRTPVSEPALLRSLATDAVKIEIPPPPNPARGHDARRILREWCPFGTFGTTTAYAVAACDRPRDGHGRGDDAALRRLQNAVGLGRGPLLQRAPR